MEWAVAHSKVVLLQSRAVTTTLAPIAAAGVPGDDAWPPRDERDGQPFDLWTQYDLGERWPEPVTPLTWSVWAPLIERNMNDGLRGLRAPYAGRIRWAKRAFGHVYLNEGALIHAYTDGMGLPKTMIAGSLTGVVEVKPEENRLSMGQIAATRPFFRPQLCSRRAQCGRLRA